jgi:adenosine 3'-phospho 5'-phosphosulfate transporter B3
MGTSDDNHQHAMIMTAASSSQRFEMMSSNTQFAILGSAVFVFFGIHNYLQEAIMNVPGWNYGVMLGFFEVLGVTVCSFWERHYIRKEYGRAAPISAYPLLTGCLLASSALSNLSLNFINFPTKVVFRSCKLIPTMIIASIWHAKIFSSVEYICAFAICVGLVLFAAADWELAPSFHPIGLLFVTLSVCADAVLPNAQERLFQAGSSRLEVTVYTNILTLIAMTFTTMLSGDLWGCWKLLTTSDSLLSYILIYTIISYVAISMHMNVVKRFGGVTAVLVATGRKGMTLILSFVLFPKGFSWFYPAGAILVLGGLMYSSLYKMSQKKGQQPRSQLKHHASDVQELSDMDRKPLIAGV